MPDEEATFMKLWNEFGLKLEEIDSSDQQPIHLYYEYDEKIKALK